MPSLIATKGPLAGREYPLGGATVVLGRQMDATIGLDSPVVSRHHARILCQDGTHFVEDLHSCNGTFLNGELLRERMRLVNGDTVQIGPFMFTYRQEQEPIPADTDLIIRQEINADGSDQQFLTNDPARKLEVVLEIGRHLASILDVDAILGKVVEELLRLFPQADRGLALLCEGENFALRAFRTRQAHKDESYPFSRTLVSRVLEGGVGVLSEDVKSDQRFKGVTTLDEMEILSLLCVPLIGEDGRRLGVLQLDCFEGGRCFDVDDLQLLTAVALQVSVALEKAALHAKLVREEQLRQEVALARQIQQGFLPVDFPPPEKGFELFARVRSAREVSGDLYDFFFLEDGRVAFLVGDVSGKGVPAALFMLAVRTLARHPGTAGKSPSQALGMLNQALTADNVADVFVTLVYGIYQPSDGEVVMASCGHPPPLLRRTDGRAEVLVLPSGNVLGPDIGATGASDFHMSLAVGETLMLYTDGFTEALQPQGGTLFGVARLREAVESAPTSVRECAAAVERVVERFTGGGPLQDDQTLLLIRRLV